MQKSDVFDIDSQNNKSRIKSMHALFNECSLDFQLMYGSFIPFNIDI